MAHLASSGDLATHSNFPNDCLWLMLAGDKGGSSTKLMLVFLNAKKQHSVHTGQMLALFQGCKDSCCAIEIVFGPLYKQAEDLIQRVQQLQLPCPAPLHVQANDKDHPSPPKSYKHHAAGQRRQKKMEKGSVKSFQLYFNELLDHTNKTWSEQCRTCQRGSLCTDEQEQPGENDEKKTLSLAVSSVMVVTGRLYPMSLAHHDLTANIFL